MRDLAAVWSAGPTHRAGELAESEQRAVL